MALKDGEIVGLGSSSNGRSCQQHGTCGSAIVIGSLIRFRSCVVDIDGAVEEVLNIIDHYCYYYYAYL